MVESTTSYTSPVQTGGLFLELSFSKNGGVHDKLHISSADWWDILLPLKKKRSLFFLICSFHSYIIKYVNYNLYKRINYAVKN